MFKEFIGGANGAVFISIVLSFFGFSINGMVSYVLLQKGSDARTAQKLFIIGEAHAGEKGRQFADQTTADITRVIDIIKRSKPVAALPILVEWPEADHELVNQAAVTPVIGRLLAYGKNEKLAPSIKVMRVDRRGIKDMVIASVLFFIHDLIDQIGIGKKTMAALIQESIGFAYKYSYVTYSVKEYLQALEGDFAFLRSLTDKKEMPNAFVLNSIDTFAQAQLQVIEKLHEKQELPGSCDTQTIALARKFLFSTNEILDDALHKALLRIFMPCQTLDELKHCYDRTNQLFNALMTPIADLGFLDKMSSISNVGTKKIILVVGNAHQKNFLHTIASELEFHILSSEDVYELKPSEIEARNKFSIKLLHAMKNFLTSGSDFCGWCLQEENVKACGRCKQVFYCSTDCQKQDWAEHKIACKQKIAQ